MGRGAAGPRAEFLLRGLAQQASDPAAIFAMGAAGSVFRMTRLAALSRLASTPSANVLTRGLGARLSAGALGFLAEAPAFTAASRLGHAALGRDQDWSLRAIGREFAGGALTLLGLKAFGGLSGLALRRYAQGPGLSSGLMRALLPQAAMLAGILASHRLEARLGLREHHDGATEFTDALATLLQFHAGGRLAHQAFGEAQSRGDRLLDARGEALLSVPRLEALELRLPRLVPAGGPGDLPNTVFAMAAGPGGTRGRRTATAQLPLPYETGLSAPRGRTLPPGLPLELRLAEGARGADAAILRSSLAYLARQGRPLSRAEQIVWIREHRLAGGIPLLGEWYRQNGSESAAALAALLAFGESHRAEVITELRTALSHPHLLVVAPALESLVALRAVEALPELRALSAAYPAPVAMFAETARVELGDAELIPVLRPRAFTWQPSALDRIAALEALGRLGQVEEALPELRGFFRYSRTVYFRAGLALTRLRSEAAIPNPVAMREAASLAERADWAEAYVASGRPERAVELWRSLLASNDRAVQERALSRLGPRETAALLRELERLRTESPHSEVRRGATALLISAARARGDRETLESFFAAAEPASIQATEALQIAAARARLELGASPEASERLEAYLASRFSENRLRAAEALLEGGEHEGARRALEALWQDGNFEIRHRAFALWSRSRAPRPAANSAPTGGLLALLAAGTGISLALHPAVAEASVGISSGGGSWWPWYLASLGSIFAGGVLMALPNGRGEGARRGSDRPPHTGLLGWFENPNFSEERYFLAPPPEIMPENQRFLAPPAEGQVLTLGRATRVAENLFPDHLRPISRRHMDLRVVAGKVEVRAHDGSRGLRINGRNLAPFQWYELRDRDVVEFVSEAGRDIFGAKPSEEEPGEFVTVTHRLGRNPVEEQEVPAIFVFRLPRPPQTPVPPRPRRNLLEQVQGLFGSRPATPEPAEEPRRDSAPVAAFRDPEEIYSEIQRFSNNLSTPMPLLEMSLSQPDWLDPHEQRGAAARRDTLRSLLRIHRQICGNEEQWVQVATPAVGLTRPSYQSLRMPRWDGVLRQRLETYRRGLERLRQERGDFPFYTVAAQELDAVADRLNRLFEVVQLFRRHFTVPEELAAFDAIEAAYRGLRSDVANDGQRVRTATRGIDVTVRRRQRQGWAEEFSGFAGGSRAMVNMRILMGEIREVHGLPVAGSLYSALSSSTVYDRGERVVRNVRVLLEAGNGQIVAFDDGSPNVRRLVQQHRDQGRRIEEAMISVDARASGRITSVAVLGEVRDSVAQALEGLRGLRVLPPQVVYGFTGFAGEPEARAYRVDLVPDVDAPPEQWYRVAGLVRNLREGYSLLTLEANTPELGLPGLQLWVPNMEVLDLAVGDPVTALPES
ncbi:MAG: FHA domain-containing protein [Deltaproteobacteria bacterium]|nr:FHA domain-containing protein [Deltaproteobacteria bacterium]